MDKALYVDALRLMLDSRFFEEKTEELFKQSLIHGTTHLANGQEASQAGLCLAIKDGDWIVPTHRCHGFTICRGSSPFAMFSEMFGSAHGLAKGLGGSMHMPDRDHWNLGSSAVVGSGVPLATGIAYSMKRKGLNNLSVAIFGDGASSRGSVHESMNLASIWKLPVLFYCENNKYGMSASSDKMVSVPKVSDRAAAYSMSGTTVDGNDVTAVYDAVVKACNHIRSGKGPYLLEVMTYRTKGHSKSDRRLYRTAEEEAFWLAKDPIEHLKRLILKEGILDQRQIDAIVSERKQYIEDQAALALEKAADRLTSDQALDLVYAKEAL